MRKKNKKKLSLLFSILTSVSIESKEKKRKILREVMVKIELKQEDDNEEIVVEILLDSGMIGFIISSKFVRKNKFRKKKLDRLIYMRNVNNIFNHKEPIERTVKI